jgi:hypothetical protein
MFISVRPLTLKPTLYHQTAAPPFTIAQTIPVVHHKSVDTITDLANNLVQKGRLWHALHAQAFSMTQSQNVGSRVGRRSSCFGEHGLRTGKKPQALMLTCSYLALSANCHAENIRSAIVGYGKLLQYDPL